MANLIIKSSADNLVLQGSDASPAITVGATGTTTFAENATLSGTANNLGTVTAGTFNSVIGTSATGFGLVTHASQWRLHTNYAHTGALAITSNIEAVDTNSPGTIGSAMTESSGIFTFPATGIWYISFDGYLRATGGAAGYGEIYIDITTDNSSYTRASTSITSGYETNAYMGAFSAYIFDVTDTSNCKVKFLTGFPLTCTVYGSSTNHMTGFTFIRLGAT